MKAYRTARRAARIIVWNLMIVEIYRAMFGIARSTSHFIIASMN